jgi:hypothetical protein
MNYILKSFYEKNIKSMVILSDNEFKEFADVIINNSNENLSDNIYIACGYYYLIKNNMKQSYQYIDKISKSNSIKKIDMLVKLKNHMEDYINKLTENVPTVEPLTSLAFVRPQKIKKLKINTNKKLTIRNLITDELEKYDLFKILKIEISDVDELIEIYNLVINNVNIDNPNKTYLFYTIYNYYIKNMTNILEKYLNMLDLNKTNHVLLAMIYQEIGNKNKTIYHYKILYEEYQLNTLSFIKNLTSENDFQEYVKSITQSKRKLEEATKKIEEMETQDYVNFRKK